VCVWSFGLYKILFVYFETIVHESNILLSPPPTCISHAVAIRLHDYWAVYDNSSTPLLYAIHHTRLVITISCNGQWSVRGRVSRLGLRLWEWVGQFVTRRQHSTQQNWLSQQALLRILSGWPCVYNVCVCVCVILGYGYAHELVNIYPGDNTVHNKIGSANKRYCAFYRVGPVCIMCACVCALSWATAMRMSWSICIQETTQYTTKLAQPTSAIAHFIGLTLCV